MRTRIAVVLVCGLALSAYLSAEEKSDQDKIQGKWKIESGMRGGKSIPDERKNVTIEFAGDKMKRTAGKDQVVEMTFKLDPTKKPKAMDVDIMDKKGLGIYSLEGDTLKICHGEVGDERPTAFESKEGSNVTLVVLKRVK
jgi:uncharacterized protein (TIGR03067 family)